MVYYCTVIKEGDMFIAQFPDITNIVTGGFSHEEALSMAKEALDGCLESDVAHGRELPAPSFKDGYPVEVANHIVHALQTPTARGMERQFGAASQLALSRQEY